MTPQQHQRLLETLNQRLELLNRHLEMANRLAGHHGTGSPGAPPPAAPPGLGGGGASGGGGAGGNVLVSAVTSIKTAAGTIANTLGTILGTALTVANTIKGVGDEVAGMVNADALNIANATRKLISYNQELITLAGQFSKYGVGIREVEAQMKALRDATGLTYSETMQLVSAYESGFNFTSLQNGEKLMQNLRRAVGSNVDAMRSMLQQVQTLAQKFPDLEMSLIRLNSVDKQRLAVQSQLLVATGQISLAEAKSLQNYVNQNAQPTGADKGRLGKADDDLMAIKTTAQIFENVLLSQSETVAEYWKKLGSAITSNKDWLDKHTKTIGDSILALEAFQKGLGIWQGTGGVVGSTAKYLGMGALGFGLRGLGGGAAAGEGAAAAASATPAVATSALRSVLWNPATRLAGYPIAGAELGRGVGYGLEYLTRRSDAGGGRLVNRKANFADAGGMIGGATVGAATGGPVGAAIGFFYGAGRATYNTYQYIHKVYEDIHEQAKHSFDMLSASAIKLGALAEKDFKEAHDLRTKAQQLRQQGKVEEADITDADANRQEQHGKLQQDRATNQKALAEADQAFQNFAAGNQGWFTQKSDTESMEDYRKASPQAAENYQKLRVRRGELDQNEGDLRIAGEFANKRRKALAGGSTDDIVDMGRGEAEYNRDKIQMQRERMRLAVQQKTGQGVVTDDQMHQFEQEGLKESLGFSGTSAALVQAQQKVQSYNDPETRKKMAAEVDAHRKEIVQKQKDKSDQERMDQLDAQVHQSQTAGRLNRAFNTGNVAGLYEEQQKAQEALQNQTADVSKVKTPISFQQVQSGSLAVDKGQQAQIFAADNQVRQGTDATAAIDTQIKEAESRLAETKKKTEEARTNKASDQDLAILNGQAKEAENVLGYWTAIRGEQVKGQQELQKTTELIGSGLTAKLNESKIAIEAMNQKYSAQKALLDTMIETMQATGDVNVDQLNVGLQKALDSNNAMVAAQQKQLAIQQNLAVLNQSTAKQQYKAADNKASELEKQALGEQGSKELSGLRGKGLGNMSAAEVQRMAALQQKAADTLNDGTAKGKQNFVDYTNAIDESQRAQSGMATSQAAIDAGQAQQQQMLAAQAKERLDLARKLVTAYDGQLQKLQAMAALRQAQFQFTDESGGTAEQGATGRHEAESATQKQIVVQQQKIAGFANARLQLEKNIDDAIAQNRLPASEREAELARGKAQLDTDEFHSNQELVGLKRELLNIQRSYTDLNKLNVELTRSQVSQAETLVSIGDSIGLGVKASAEQRWNVVRALEEEKRLQSENLTQIRQQEAEKSQQLNQARAGGDQKVIQDAEGAYKTIHNERIKKETEILQLQMKQIEATRAMRDNYVSAISAMTTGAGVFNKVVVDQEHNFGSFLGSTRGAVQSLTTGGIGMNGTRAGQEDVSRMRLDSAGNMNVSGPSDDSYYNIYNAGGASRGSNANRLLQGMREDLKYNRIGGLSNKLGEMGGTQRSMEATAFGANPNLQGAYVLGRGNLPAAPGAPQPGANAAAPSVQPQPQTPANPNVPQQLPGGVVVPKGPENEQKGMLDLVKDIRDFVADIAKGAVAMFMGGKADDSQAKGKQPTNEGNRQFSNAIPSVPGARQPDAASPQTPATAAQTTASGQQVNKPQYGGVGGTTRVGKYGYDSAGTPISEQDMTAYRALAEDDEKSSKKGPKNNMGARIEHNPARRRDQMVRGNGDGELAGMIGSPSHGRDTPAARAMSRQRRAEHEAREHYAVQHRQQQNAKEYARIAKMSDVDRSEAVESSVEKARKMYASAGREGQFDEAQARKSAESRYDPTAATKRLEKMGFATPKMAAANAPQPQAQNAQSQQAAQGSQTVSPSGTTGGTKVGHLAGSNSGVTSPDAINGGGGGAGGGGGITVNVNGLDDFANKVANAVRAEISKKGSSGWTPSQLVAAIFGSKAGSSVAANRSMST